MPSKPPIALTIAGFDPSSGAGITADLTVFAAFDVFGTAAITLETVQSTRGVAGTMESDPVHLRRTLDHLAADLPPDGVKIGALGSGVLAETVAMFLESTKINIPVVWDPALVSSSGQPLFVPEDLPVLHRTILPAVTWATPNWSELAVLAGSEVRSELEMLRAAKEVGERYPQLWLVATGGEQAEAADLLRTPAGELYWFRDTRVDSTSTHGTGCAFSSALLAGLICGQTPLAAVAAAKNYVVEAIRRAPGLGSGCGPLDLYWPLRRNAG